MNRIGSRIGRLVVIALLAAASRVRAEESRLEPPKFPEPKVRAWQTGLLRADRIQHASLSMTIGFGFGMVSRSPSAAFGSALALGFAKEMWDRKHTRFDTTDLWADTIGASLAAVATAALRNNQ